MRTIQVCPMTGFWNMDERKRMLRNLLSSNSKATWVTCYFFSFSLFLILVATVTIPCMGPAHNHPGATGSPVLHSGIWIFSNLLPSTVHHLCTHCDHGCLTSVLGRELLKPCQWPLCYVKLELSLNFFSITSFKHWQKGWYFASHCCRQECHT